MNASHFELMQTLQAQRDTLAEIVGRLMFAPEAYAEQRTLAVDRLDQTQYVIWRGMKPKPLRLGVQLKRLKCIEANTAVIEKLNAALVTMPPGDWTAVSAGLATEGAT